MNPTLSKCKTKGCRRRLKPEKNHSPYCPRCASRRFKEKFPLKYAFNCLRTRARQRGKEFTLTYAEYEAFAIKTDYAKLKGKTSLSLSIHRKDNDRGYSADNIDAITLSLNSRLMYAPMPDYIRQEMIEEDRRQRQAIPPLDPF